MDQKESLNFKNVSFIRSRIVDGKLVVPSMNAVQMEDKYKNNFDKLFEDYMKLPELPYGQNLKITKIGRFNGNGPVHFYSDDKMYKVDENLWSDIDEIIQNIVSKQMKTMKKIFPHTFFIDDKFKFMEELKRISTI